MLRKVAVFLLFGLFLFPAPVLGAEQITLLSGERCEDILDECGGKLLLDKQWSTYSFEINSQDNLANFSLQPVDSVRYGKALAEVDYPLEVAGEYRVYFLPYRLKDYPAVMALSFPDDSAVVFASYYEYSPEQLHRLAVHELGHQVGFRLMDEEKWEEYRRIRGIADQSVYDNSSSIPENRPQEIFAEDFRLLFGSEAARRIPHMNGVLAPPDKIGGLKEYLYSLE